MAITFLKLNKKSYEQVNNKIEEIKNQNSLRIQETPGRRQQFHGYNTHWDDNDRHHNHFYCHILAAKHLAGD
jgi:hypothetical protein